MTSRFSAIVRNSHKAPARRCVSNRVYLVYSANTSRAPVFNIIETSLGTSNKDQSATHLSATVARPFIPWMHIPGMTLQWRRMRTSVMRRAVSRRISSMRASCKRDRIWNERCARRSSACARSIATMSVDARRMRSRGTHLLRRRRTLVADVTTARDARMTTQTSTALHHAMSSTPLPLVSTELAPTNQCRSRLVTQADVTGACARRNRVRFVSSRRGFPERLKVDEP